jgi:D-lysine oxidase
MVLSPLALKVQGYIECAGRVEPARSEESHEMPLPADVIVLGAGMVGVSIALNLQERGRDVILIDRRGPGEETSYGNAGLIQREAMTPYAFPQEFGLILSYATNRRRDAVYHLAALPRLFPWLFAYWRNSAPERIARAARALAPLFALCVGEHERLIAAAGGAAPGLVQRDGWIDCFRREETLRREAAKAGRLEQHGVDCRVLTGAELRALEPHLSAVFVGAVHYRGSPTSSDPGGLTNAYADLFQRRGGRFCHGDARRLAPAAAGWSLATQTGTVEARETVVALGPWSDDVFRPLGYAIPLGVKRGYHMHYGLAGNATLGHALRDADGGFALAPMRRGIRLTTGVEFALRDAPPTPVQLARDEPLARQLLPLTERLEPEPWLGRRPCLPDMVPIIGKGSRHRGLWFAFGHAHHGFTLGPVTGRLLAAMMTGEAPFTDPSPYAAARFDGGMASS